MSEYDECVTELAEALRGAHASRVERAAVDERCAAEKAAAQASQDTAEQRCIAARKALDQAILAEPKDQITVSGRAEQMTANVGTVVGTPAPDNGNAETENSAEVTVSDVVEHPGEGAEEPVSEEAPVAPPDSEPSAEKPRNRPAKAKKAPAKKAGSK